METACLSDCVQEESLRISRLLFETPRTDRKAVEEYHAEIKIDLDSGKIITVPSRIHRILHEIMWIKGHEIYNKFQNFIDAAEHFCKIESSLACQEVRNEEKRFRRWYIEEYVLDEEKYKHGHEPIDEDWIGVITREARI